MGKYPSQRSYFALSFCPRGGIVTFTIVLLALVAAFLGLRLYSVLGKRTGHEQEPVARQPLDSTPPLIRQPMSGGESSPALPQGEISNVDLAAQSGLRSIVNADRQFDLGLFVEGAKSAYKIVLEAYWKGDKESLRFLCDDDVYDSFAEEIDGRTSRGETLENRLVRIEDARVVDASFDLPMARITLRFDADIAALVKDAAGNVIGGSMTDAVETHDIWTFMRDVKSGDRNWKLDETDSV
jgi:predicted lipid-binding transport protein (Tim44 family)